MSKIKPRTARVVIYQGDDLARLAELDDAVKRAEQLDKRETIPLDAAVDKAERDLEVAEKLARAANVRLMSDADPLAVARQAYSDAKAARDAFVGAALEKKVERDDFAAEAEARGVAVVLIARPRLRWRELMREHPPRDADEHPEDHVLGPANIDTLPDALLPESIDREMSTIEGDLHEFLESLANVDYYDRLFVQAFALNRGAATADPTRRLLSGSQTSGVTTS